ncbi:MAG: hydantoinase/oxoprolinase family protein [Euryarchaeota archaeon]|nr:hydantoinase/oxoprolinase family protein [Euryarchaeota archaeon]
MSAILGVDIGGTFTDFFLLKNGNVETLKIPSTPENPAEAVLEGVRRLGGAEYIAHGTTHATNILIEKKGAKIALITTKGFRDLLEIGRQNRPELYNFFVSRPKPLIEKQDRFEVTERIDADGNVLKPLDEAEVRQLDLDEYEAATVCLLFSYMNPSHEKKIKELLDLPVSLSSEVLPEFREYERVSTTVINTYLMPAMDAYLSSLEDSLDGRLTIIQSNGSTISSKNARRTPAKTILSGPAAGVKAAVFLSESMGYNNVITMDMGGTSCDVSLVENSTPRITTEAVIDGYPIRFPSIDIHTVGAGGGSIAWVDEGLLRVGPESMGADPGPACYSLGGEKPTVTDANLLLGYLPEKLADGTKLDKKKSFDVINELGETIGLEPIETALGIVKVADANMSSAIRVVSVQRGYDPRNFSLIVFGGAGPLHAGRIAEEIGMETVLIPNHSGVLSALGAVVSPPACDFVQSYITPLRKCSLENVEEIYVKMEERGSELIARVEQAERFMDLRYKGQSYEITIPIDSLNFEKIEKEFHKAHKKLYGYTGEGIELVNLRSKIFGEKHEVHLKKAEKRELKRYARDAYFGKMMKTPVYYRETLSPGMELPGPCIIEGKETTVLVRSTETASVDGYLNIIMRR